MAVKYCVRCRRNIHSLGWARHVTGAYHKMTAPKEEGLMDLDKAIDILTNMREIIFNYKSPDRKDALQLGIEALKRVKAGRPAPPSLAFLPLPGEH